LVYVFFLIDHLKLFTESIRADGFFIALNKDNPTGKGFYKKGRVCVSCKFGFKIDKNVAAAYHLELVKHGIRY
jgi:hypothetical protein